LERIEINYLVLLGFLAVSAGISAGCTQSAITPEATELGMPAGWVRGGEAGTVDLNWLESFDDPQLTSLVSEAVTNNYLLEQERARLYQAEQTVIIVRADRFPDLDVSIDASRRGFTDASDQRATSESYGAEIGARWEVDLWGRLSKEQQAAQLALGAQQARFESVQRNLAAATTGAYVMEAKQLLEVARRRLDNAIESHDIVASGYRQGLNDALDLYLARNQVERQQANFAQQQQTLTETIYPDGRIEMPGALPVIMDPIPSGLPSELLTRRTDVQEAWLNLLAADADLAAAHKARFPSLSLVGSAGVASAEFSELLDTDLSVWSIAGSVTQPLFNAGRLEAIEEQALARVRQAEQQYLDLVFRAFADVENAISRSVSLMERYESFLDAETNSRAALNLALEQYQRGLVPYTTVLESQRQAFDAEATVVELKNLLLQNRIALYLALGGEFATEY
jgi:NodT family efflux transporter outer membrane factor (OMF) lipoprotein